MRAVGTVAFMLATTMSQGARAEVGALALATSSPIQAANVMLDHGGEFRLRTATGVVASRDYGAGVHKRMASSMIDFYPDGGGDGFRVSAGFRLDPKRAKGSLARLADGAGGGLMNAGSNIRRMGSPRGTSPAMTMGYGVGDPEQGMLSFEAGAMMAHNRNTRALDMSDPMNAARTAAKALNGKGDSDIGKVVRLSFAKRF